MRTMFHDAEILEESLYSGLLRYTRNDETYIPLCMIRSLESKKDVAVSLCAVIMRCVQRMVVVAQR